MRSDFPPSSRKGKESGGQGSEGKEGESHRGWGSYCTALRSSSVAFLSEFLNVKVAPFFGARLSVCGSCHQSAVGAEEFSLDDNEPVFFLESLGETLLKAPVAVKGQP